MRVKTSESWFETELTVSPTNAQREVRSCYILTPDHHAPGHLYRNAQVGQRESATDRHCRRPDKRKAPTSQCQHQITLTRCT